MNSFKSHHSPKVKLQSPPSQMKKLKNHVVNVVAPLRLAKKKGRQFPVREIIIDRIIEEENKILSDLSHLPIFGAFDSHFTEEFNEFRSI